MKEIQCITLSRGRIEKFNTIQELLALELEEIFIIDMDALRKGRPSIKFYSDISKYFQVYALSLCNRLDDLVDSLISGCEGVVISPLISEKLLNDFLEVSENIIMPYTSLPSSRAFSLMGGSYYLCNVTVNYKFKTNFYYGLGDPGVNHYAGIYKVSENLLSEK